MATPLKQKKCLKEKKKLQLAPDNAGDECSTPAAKSRGLGELIRSFAEKLDFADLPSIDSSPDAASTRSTITGQMPELRTSLRQLTQRLGSLQTAAGTLAQRLAGEDAPKGQPVGCAAYMDMKVQMMLSYVIGLNYYLLLKSRGAKIRDHPVSLRLMWLRTLMEKLRPVDQRLQYQMNKLLEAAEAKAGGLNAAATDPRSLRPGELATTVEDDGVGDGDEEEADVPAADDDDGVYRPPRIAQVEYTGDHISSKEKAERDYERQKARFERSDMVRSLREEFSQAPLEIRGEERNAAAEKAQRKHDEITAYEEDNMIRLRATKEEKREKQRLYKAKRTTSGGTVSLEDFGNLNDIAAIMSTGGKGKGKGKRGKRGGGTALGSFKAAEERLRGASAVVDSVSGGRMPEGMGSFKRGRGGLGDGDGMGGGKKKKLRSQSFM